MIIKKLTGFIVKTQPLGELDRLILVFSSQYGLVQVLGKGVRNIRSRRGCHLDLFNEVRMEVEEIGAGMNVRRYLREVSSIQTHSSLKKDPASFAAACIMISFLIRVLPRETPQPQIFDLTKKMFIQLGSGEDIRKNLLTYFLKTARELGHLPNKLSETEMRPLLSKILHELDPEFAFQARRTLGIFSNLESSLSS